MKYILRYQYWQYGPITGGSYSPTIQSNRVSKTLIFHNPGDVDNWIRNHVTAQTLIKLELEYATVE